MRSVDLDRVKADLQSTTDCIGIRLLETFNVLKGHSTRVCVVLVPGDSRRCKDIVWPSVLLLWCNSSCAQPGSHTARLTTCVCELDGDELVLTTQLSILDTVDTENNSPDCGQSRQLPSKEPSGCPSKDRHPLG